jgi:O-antigen/teichoic acid export membrane protein
VSAAPPPDRPTKGLRGLLSNAVPGERGTDHRVLLAGTGQNLAGLGVFVVASLATSVLIARVLGNAALGLVTLATQLAFVGGAGTRFGMDMAAVRRVAIDVGKGEPGRARAVVRRAALIAALVSVVVATAVFLGASTLAHAFARTSGSGGVRVFQAAALALPFVALVQVYLGGTRGLKVMRHTLTVYWAGQPLVWIAVMLAGWAVVKTPGTSVFAYAVSWVLATGAAWFLWERETKRFPHLPAPPDETAQLIRYGAPRAPAALLSQLLFWTDYFVVAHYITPAKLGVYAAAVRVAQAIVLFLIAVNYMFSPFVADLHARGERARLDGLYKTLTRWTLAGTIPILLLLLVVPGPVLLIFGSHAGFEGGVTALRILVIGQAVNVAVGSVGFILIMVGRTGWDLVMYAGSFALDLALAFVLARRFGANGAAVAQAVTLSLSNAARLYLVWRFVGIQPFNRHYARLAVPAGIAAAAMIGGHLLLVDRVGWPVDLVGTGLIGLAVYVAAFLATALTATERVAVARALGRSGPSK